MEKLCKYCSEIHAMESHDLCEGCADFLYEIDRQREIEEIIEMEKEQEEKNGYYD